jgi:hypothetical protein
MDFSYKFNKRWINIFLKIFLGCIVIILILSTINLMYKRYDFLNKLSSKKINKIELFVGRSSTNIYDYRFNITQKDSIDQFLKVLKTKDGITIDDRNYKGYSWEIYFYDKREVEFYHLTIDTNNNSAMVTDNAPCFGKKNISVYLFSYNNFEIYKYLQKFGVPLYDSDEHSVAK